MLSPTALSFPLFSISMHSLAKRIVNNFAQKEEPQPMAYPEPTISTPLLAKSASSSDSESSLQTSNQSPPKELQCCIPGTLTVTGDSQHKSLAILSGHIGSVSCVALCGEFLLSASHGKDIIAWQQPDLRQFTKFGHGDGTVKALVSIGNRVFSAHQDSRIRVWKVSRSSENIFRLTATLPTTKDCFRKCMKQSNYVQTRRNHRKLWIEHADSISCLAVYGGVIYSGSWDKTLKVWRVADLRCLESIRAHDDAINGLVAHEGLVYSASADGKIKVWEKGRSMHCLKGVLGGRRDVSWNAVIVCEEGRLVYGGGSDGRVMGWERDRGRENWRLVCDARAHEMAVLCLCSMGEFVCSGSADKSIGVWRRESGGGLWRVGVIRGHEGPVKCLQASCYSVGEGFMLYSGGLDRSLRVWWVPKECSGGQGEWSGQRIRPGEITSCCTRIKGV